MVTILGVALAAVGTVIEYPEQFPKAMDELLLDRRYLNPRRCLRRPYLEPITGSAEWG